MRRIGSLPQIAPVQVKSEVIRLQGRFADTTVDSSSYVFFLNRLYTPGFIRIFINKKRLTEDEYIASNGKDIRIPKTYTLYKNDLIEIHTDGVEKMTKFGRYQTYRVRETIEHLRTITQT